MERDRQQNDSLTDGCMCRPKSLQPNSTPQKLTSSTHRQADTSASSTEDEPELPPTPALKHARCT